MIDKPNFCNLSSHRGQLRLAAKFVGRAGTIGLCGHKRED